jgi:hypothetical protein
VANCCVFSLHLSALIFGCLKLRELTGTGSNFFVVLWHVEQKKQVARRLTDIVESSCFQAIQEQMNIFSKKTSNFIVGIKKPLTFAPRF